MTVRQGEHSHCGLSAILKGRWYRRPERDPRRPPLVQGASLRSSADHRRSFCAGDPHRGAAGRGSAGGGSSACITSARSRSGWTRHRASVRTAVPRGALELEHDRRPREPSALLLAPPRLVGVRRQRSGPADHVGAVRRAHDPARLRTRPDDPRPSARHRQRAAVRDLTVPGLVRARGAGVLPPHARGDGGDAGRRLSPAPVSNDR